MCLTINHERTEVLKKELPEEFIVYKAVKLEIIDGQTKLSSPLQPTNIVLKEKLIANGTVDLDWEIEEGAIHTLYTLEDAKNYVNFLPKLKRYKETDTKFVIIKCLAQKKNFLAIGKAMLVSNIYNIIHTENSICFTEILPLEILNEQVS